MDSDSVSLYRAAYDRYLTENNDLLEPSQKFLPFDFAWLAEVKWRNLGYHMVEDELRELTNIINQWNSYLRRWHKWNLVLEEWEGDDAWRLRREFLEALVHHCMLQPSSIRDAFTYIATNSIHQIRLSAENEYKDYLDGEPKSPKDKPVFLSRRKKEQRLKRVLSNLPNSREFLESLYLLNDKAYKMITSDYRNRVNHAIAPRLGLGITQMVTRNVKQKTEMERQPDGTYQLIPVEGEMQVSYGFGGVEPLDYEQVRQSNLQQFFLTDECYRNYIKLLKSGIENMPRVTVE